MNESIRLVRHPGPTGEDKVCLLVNGQLTADLPKEVARALGIQLISMAKQIENDANPQKQIIDQAILMRAGVKLGLNNNPKLLAEAHKEAQWNGDLRRYMKNPQGIKSSEVVGTPTIIRGEPR